LFHDAYFAEVLQKYTLCSHEYVSRVFRDHLHSMSDMVHTLQLLGYQQKHSRV